jgi:hypothetical protein
MTKQDDDRDGRPAFTHPPSLTESGDLRKYIGENASLVSLPFLQKYVKLAASTPFSA